MVDPSSDSSLVTVADSSLKRSNELSQELDKTLNELSITETTSQLQKSLDKVKEIEAEIDRNITWIKGIFVFLQMNFMNKILVMKTLL